MSVTVITHYDGWVTRWEPDSRGRLEQAARPASPSVASRTRPWRRSPSGPGVTERTFFRHFSDKREVLFSGAALLREALVNGVASGAGHRVPNRDGRAGVRGHR